jgi:hypothetical protein
MPNNREIPKISDNTDNDTERQHADIARLARQVADKDEKNQLNTPSQASGGGAKLDEAVLVGIGDQFVNGGVASVLDGSGMNPALVKALQARRKAEGTRLHDLESLNLKKMKNDTIDLIKKTRHNSRSLNREQYIKYRSILKVMHDEKREKAIKNQKYTLEEIEFYYKIFKALQEKIKEQKEWREAFKGKCDEFIKLRKDIMYNTIFAVLGTCKRSLTVITH